MFKENSDDQWVFGLNLLTQYTVDFDLDNMAFSIKDYSGFKSWESNQEPFELVSVENSTPWDKIGVQAALSTVLFAQVYY